MEHTLLHSPRQLHAFIFSVFYTFPLFLYISLRSYLFESIELIQSYRSLDVNRLNHVLCKTNHQSCRVLNEFNQFSQFCGKMNLFKSINSIELIGMQVWR